MSISKVRQLVLDIETKPIEAFVWGLFDQNIGLDFIKSDWSILSYSAKWLGEPTVFYKDTGGRGAKKVSDDSVLLGDLWKLLDEADIVIGQNLQSFDVKKVNARLLQAGYGPYSPIRTIDTMRSARKHAAFTSNKLAYLTKALTETKKSEHRDFPGMELWLECMKDNPKAWRVMKKYNQLDVVSTEQLYIKLRPWIGGHPNMSTFHVGGPTCPKCDSPKQQARGFTVTQGGKYQRYQCQACGGWSRGKQSLLDAEVRRSKLV